jgi:hypothetical protein
MVWTCREKTCRYVVVRIVNQMNVSQIQRGRGRCRKNIRETIIKDL